MAVLVEAISVIIRADAIKERYPGGWTAFRDGVPNHTLACDDEVARVGFMTPGDVQGFIETLEARGLAFQWDGEAVDCVVIDQQRGPTTRCSWVEFGYVAIYGHHVAACSLAGSKSTVLITPDGWVYEHSLSQTFGFLPLGQEKKSLDFLRHEDGLDVFRNRLTGEEVFIGRTRGPTG